jgi:hypothetical protein
MRDEWDDDFTLAPLPGRPGQYRATFADGSYCDGWVPSHR